MLKKTTNPQIPHDPLYKQFFSYPQMVESLLRDFVPEDFVKDLDFSTMRRCFNTYVTKDRRERRNDIVWRIKWKSDEWLYMTLILEFQSSPDPLMALRMLTYSGLLLTDTAKEQGPSMGLPAVFPVVIYNGEEPWKTPLGVTPMYGPMPLRSEFYCPHQNYFLLDKNFVPQQQLQEKKGLVGILIRLERTYDPDIINVILEELTPLLPGDFALPLQELFLDLIDYRLTKAGIEGISKAKNIEEAHAMLKETYGTWKEKLISQGQQKLLLKILTNKFGLLPQPVTAYIEKTPDVDEQSRLAYMAITSDSLEVFLNQLQTLPGYYTSVEKQN